MSFQKDTTTTVQQRDAWTRDQTVVLHDSWGNKLEKGPTLICYITIIKPQLLKTREELRIAMLTQNVDKARDALTAEKKRLKVL